VEAGRNLERTGLRKARARFPAKDLTTVRNVVWIVRAQLSGPIVER